jgi:thiamine-phosphate pyrophosphorylase
MISPTKRSILRIIDANANRALEGLRVGEDIVRFHLEDAPAFRRLRALRHSVARTVTRLPIGTVELVRSRNSGHDLGKRSPAPRVFSLERLLLINLQRTKESLRTLEECARLIAPRQTPEFQRLRFRTYEVERDLLIKLSAVHHS